MADDIECAPSVFTFIAQRPRFRQITQKRIENSRGATEKGYRVAQVEFHHAPPCLAYQFLCTGKSIFRHVVQRDLTAAQRKHRCKPVSHEAGANYGYVFHGSNRLPSSKTSGPLKFSSKSG